MLPKLHLLLELTNYTNGKYNFDDFGILSNTKEKYNPVELNLSIMSVLLYSLFCYEKKQTIGVRELILHILYRITNEQIELFKNDSIKVFYVFLKFLANNIDKTISKKILTKFALENNNKKLHLLLESTF